MTDLDNVMNPLHFATNPTDIRIRINPKIRIRIPDHFWLKFLWKRTSTTLGRHGHPHSSIVHRRGRFVVLCTTCFTWFGWDFTISLPNMVYQFFWTQFLWMRKEPVHSEHIQKSASHEYILHLCQHCTNLFCTVHCCCTLHTCSGRLA